VTLSQSPLPYCLSINGLVGGTHVLMSGGVCVYRPVLPIAAARPQFGILMCSTQLLPNYLRAYRKRSGLSQKEFAFVADVCDKSELCGLERFRRVPSYWTAACCACALGVSTDELFCGVRYSARKETIRRMRQLRRLLLREERGDGRFKQRIGHKLEWLCEHLGE
jgi:transcriptional regulator with XRE-family HTH domain